MQLLNMEVPCVLILSTESGKARTLAQGNYDKFLNIGYVTYHHSLFTKFFLL